MREIKLRGWDKEKKTMIYFGAIQVDYTAGFWKDRGIDNYRITFEREAEEVGGYNHSDFNVETELEVMQFTGLLDKNGKEIYEGDIVRSTETVQRGEVQFYDGEDSAEYGIQWHEDKLWWSNCFKGTEVIGNVYESPELLEEEK